VDLLRVRWEKNMQAYLPMGEDGMPVIPEQPAADDEYEGLTPEEIEAVTGSRPQPKAAARPVARQPEPGPAPEEQLSADALQRLMGLALGGSEPEPAPADDPTSGMMSLDEIEALTQQFNKPAEPKPSARRPAAKPQPAEEAETELSAEDIWRQISGGK